MRRLLLALASTAAGLAAVLSFKTHSSAVASGDAAAAPAIGTQGSASPAAPAGNVTGASPLSGGSTARPASTASPASAARSAPAAPKTGGASAATTRTITGAVASTQYGPMQVQVTLQGRTITDVKVLQETNLGSLSQQIDSNAIPQLTKETLAAQSARIDAVSGASYTSAGYIQSLQSALDQVTA